MKHLTPKEAHAFIHANTDAVFVDVRSEIEFFYVGHPVGAMRTPQRKRLRSPMTGR